MVGWAGGALVDEARALAALMGTLEGSRARKLS
jgi:hypothetical protein